MFFLRIVTWLNEAPINIDVSVNRVTFSVCFLPHPIIKFVDLGLEKADKSELAEAGKTVLDVTTNEICTAISDSSILLAEKIAGDKPNPAITDTTYTAKCIYNNKFLYWTNSKLYTYDISTKTTTKIMDLGSGSSNIVSVKSTTIGRYAWIYSDSAKIIDIYNNQVIATNAGGVQSSFVTSSYVGSCSSSNKQIYYKTIDASQNSYSTIGIPFKGGGDVYPVKVSSGNVISIIEWVSSTKSLWMHTVTLPSGNTTTVSIPVSFAYSVISVLESHTDSTHVHMIFKETSGSQYIYRYTKIPIANPSNSTSQIITPLGNPTTVSYFKILYFCTFNGTMMYTVNTSRNNNHLLLINDDGSMELISSVNLVQTEEQFNAPQYNLDTLISKPIVDVVLIPNTSGYAYNIKEKKLVSIYGRCNPAYKIDSGYVSYIKTAVSKVIILPYLNNSNATILCIPTEAGTYTNFVFGKPLLRIPFLNEV